jgi:MoaA/NifB/PqqE/SkfB family radical SAM enzyme
MEPIKTNHPLIAVRSLQSHHHAEHIIPKIVKITWMIGKRCNYDCSYCTPHLHDAISPHLDLSIVQKTIDTIDRQMLLTGKKTEYALTGGEPFVHPKIEQLLEIITKSKTYNGRLSAISNGSLPIKIYNKCMPFLSNLTISLHLEVSKDETEKIVRRLCELKQRWPDHFIATNIMFIPGSKDRVLDIKRQLVEHGIKTAIRRIRPNSDGYIKEDPTPILPMVSKKDRKIALLPMSEQNDLLEKYKNLKDQHVQKWTKDYYSLEDLEFLKQEEIADFQNMAVWAADGSYTETHSDQITAQNLNRFLGWKCFSGIDALSINFDGTVYNGQCFSHVLGHISSDIVIPQDPLLCPKQNCLSNPDVVVRKCHPGYENLVNNIHN